MTETQLKSVVDLHKYAQEVATRRPEGDPAVQKLHQAKQMVWLCLLTCMFLFYYLLDKMSEALALL